MTGFIWKVLNVLFIYKLDKSVNLEYICCIHNQNVLVGISDEEYYEMTNDPLFHKFMLD